MLATTFLFRQSMRWAMLVVSEVLTTIEPSGLTATPSGSTPTGNSAHHLAGRSVDGGQSASFFVGDENELPIGAHAQLFRVGPRRQFADLLQGLCINNRNRIVVAETNEHQRVVLAQRYAARPLVLTVCVTSSLSRSMTEIERFSRW